MNEQQANESTPHPPRTTRREMLALILLHLPLVAYFAGSLAAGRLYFFEDDFIRLNLAYYLFEYDVIAWGHESAWPPGGVLFQGLAHKVLFPFSVKVSVLLTNLSWTFFSSYLLFRLARRLAEGLGALVPVVLYALSPTVLWLATSALIEPFFIGVLLAQSVMLVRYFESARLGDFTGAAALAALLTMIRFEGWVLGPGLMAGAAAISWWRDVSWSWRLPALAASTLVLPAAWMAGSWVRYGDPVQFASSHAERLIDYYATESPEEFLGVLGEGLSAIAGTVGWLMLLGGVVAFCLYSSLNPGRKSNAGGMVIAAVFLLTTLMFFYFSMRQGWGLWHPRFLVIWYVMGLPLTSLLFAPLGERWRELLFALVTALVVIDAIGTDARRVDVRQSLGPVALRMVEHHPLAASGRAELRLLVPPGKLDYAQAAVLIYAPSIAEYGLETFDGVPEHAASIPGADFLMFRKEYYPGTYEIPGYELLHEDSYYRAFVAMDGREESSSSPGD